MKVVQLQSMALSLPLKRPFIGASQLPRNVINPVLVQLRTDKGLEAFGLAFAWNNRQIKSLKACIDDLEEIILGQDIFRWAEAWQKLWNNTKHMGHQGYGMYALAALDTALRSLQAEALQIPLARLLGGYRDTVPVYASHSLFRNWSIDELQADAAALVDEGFRALKMNMGDKPSQMELERVKAIREAVGPEIDILIDVNWGWTVAQTVRIGRELERYNVYWLEDPVFSDEVNELEQISNELVLPIAAGETLCSKYGFRPLIDKRAVDILIIDLQRVGGVTEWMKVAAIAEAWNLPVASHLFHDFSAHLIAAIPNGLIVEYMPWWDEIYEEPPQVVEGSLKISDKPGVGLQLNRRALRKYEMT